MRFLTEGTTLTVSRDQATLAQLEQENARLQRLVADLLMKNQQLRVELKAAQRTPGFAANFGRVTNN